MTGWKKGGAYAIINTLGQEGSRNGKKSKCASDQTKYALAAALKELMAQKPIDRITIHDLTERCGIRRQTFYYHFEDVYDLLRWMFQAEAVALLTHIYVVVSAGVVESWLLGEIERTPEREQIVCFAKIL